MKTPIGGPFNGDHDKNLRRLGSMQTIDFPMRRYSENKECRLRHRWGRCIGQLSLHVFTRRTLKSTLGTASGRIGQFLIGTQAVL